MNFNNVEFCISAAAEKDFPSKRLPEIAFAGKSNVGKSSVINRVPLFPLILHEFLLPRCFRFAVR